MARVYRQTKKESVKELKKIYYKNNREKILERLARWRKENPDKVRSATRNWREKNKNNPRYKIPCRLRNRLSEVLKLSGQKKSAWTMRVVGCTRDFLVSYLESKFKDGMSWENHGKTWHVDHIRPCASFDLTKEENVKACFHYTNLQPLFAKDNILKRDRWIDSAP